MSREAPRITVHRDLPFRETDERTLHLDVYEPPESGPSPAVLFVHGGGFVTGDKGQFARQAVDFADEGFVAVESQYRLGPESSFPAALVDVKAAVEWLRSEGADYGVDPDPIAVVGHSAGGNLAALAAVTADEPAFEPERYPGASSAVDALVGYVGVYDLAALDDPATNREYVGGTPAEDPERFDLASPLGQEDVTTPPTLLVHGADDGVVDPEQSERFYEALDAVTEADLELLSGDGADHLFPHHAATYERTLERTTDFLDGHL